MNLTSKYLLLFGIAAASALNSQAQTETRKVTFTGQARGLFYGDDLHQSVEQRDTVTARKLNSGHVMVDLGINIHPNKNTEIQGMVRIRNDYGGFWGSGVTFDVRQLSVKGVVGGIFRYQLGDINYRMSRYTLWNYEQELSSQTPAILQQQFDVVNYDHFFFKDNSRRMQGAAGEFALVFSKWVQELQFHMMTSRVKPSDFATVSDRLFTGLSANMIQSKYAQLGVNFASMYDVPGTSRNASTFHNPVLTGTWQFDADFEKWKAQLKGEAGRSRTNIRENTTAPDWRGKFADAEVSASLKSLGITVSANAKYVNSEFRSPGAQTKRIDFAGVPVAYQRITNDQLLRPVNMLDLMRESDFYNLQLRPYLMEFSPVYDNITPYGDATPNRQGLTFKLAYDHKKNPLKIEVSQLQWQEVRGEGTVLPREFSRTMVVAEVLPERMFATMKRKAHLSLSYRNDETTRGEEELVRGVQLATRALALGAEVEIAKSFDAMLGMQSLAYSGFDYTAVRDNYSVIFNFNEYRADGTEKMYSGGLRYRFSENTFLSATYSLFESRGTFRSVPAYNFNQIMLLYSMKF